MKKKIYMIIIIGLIVIGLTIGLIFLVKNQNKLPDDDNKEDPFTDTYLVHNGTSPYKIVIPENASSDISFAANELNYFFKRATSIQLEIISDKDLVFDENAHYLSIGKTGLLTDSGVQANYEELGLDGLRLVTKGNVVIMAGGSDSGAMYAAYEFLERTFHLKVYAEDELSIDLNVDNLFLKLFDVTEIPTFERRSVGLFPYSVNETFRNRMRQQLYNDGWIYWSHSHFKILPKDDYYHDHPDWYSPDGTQLCLSNDAMREEFTRVVIELIKDNPDCNYIMLGQEDFNTFCTCPDCLEQIALYKESGVMMHFVNKVADDVQSYIDTNEPGRIFFLGTFGYHKTQFAPVTVTENNEYIPIDDSVLPRDNVRIMVAPIYACNSHHYYDDCNKDVEMILKGWEAVAQDHIFTWIYNKIFGQYFLPFNNFSTLKQNYLILEELGSQFVYHQGNKETQAAAFQELKCYVQAKMMWDVSLNPEELAKEFIENYYQDASQTFLEYFQLMRFTHAIWEERDNIHTHNNGSKSLNTFSTDYWTRDLLDQFDVLFAQMFNEIEHLKDQDIELYEKLSFRIKKEKLTIDYLYLTFYMDEFTYDEAKQMIDDFEAMCNKAGISVWREMYLTTSTESLISSLVASWRSKLQ